MINAKMRSWEERLAPPTPLEKKANDKTGQGNILPTPDNDGTYILFSNTDIKRYTAAGAVDWTVAITDINANCNYYTGCLWLDTSDSAIWVWANDSDTTPDTYYLAKIALSDGAVTNVGTCQPGDGYFGGSASNEFTYYYMERAAMGSGDLTIRDGDYKIVLDTSDGSIVTAVAQVTQNSMPISIYSNYETADGSIYLRRFPTFYSYDYAYGYMMRGGVMRMVVIPNNSPAVSGQYPWPILWGGYVVIADQAGSSAMNGRYFNRTDFDDWLVRIADYYKLPT